MHTGLGPLLVCTGVQEADFESVPMGSPHELAHAQQHPVVHA